MEVLLTVAVVAVFLLLFLIFRSYTQKAPDLSPQMVDLRNQLEELKLRQLEGQTSSLTQQQKLLLDSQKEVRDQLNQILKTVGDSLNSTQGNINTQLKVSNEVIGEIQKKLGSLETTTKNIQEIGKDISSLQEILQAPKLRGNLGEYLLEELLKDILPSKNYQMKLSFQNGNQVDAAIRLGEGIVPVDSKFPLESFQRLVKAGNDEEKRFFKKEFVTSVKRRIDEIASKYINPSEGTFDFAMMYIPAENVFYEIIVNDSLTNRDYEIFNYAIQKHVIPVSPNSFYSYLMALVYGLKGFRIEQQAKTIIGELSKVQETLTKFYADFSLLGRHLGNAQGKYDDSLKKAEKLNEQVGKITGNKVELLGDAGENL